MMRMIDRYRTPTQMKIISALEKIKMGTAHDIGIAMGLEDTTYGRKLNHRHLYTLLDDEIIHVCGYNTPRHPVYALLYKEADE